jgi:HEAT repeat protein
MQREIVQRNILQELAEARPGDRPRLQQFLRTNGLLDACIDRARTGRGWYKREALVTLGATLMPEAIPALADALDDRQLETRLAAIRGLARTGLSQAAEPILEHLMTPGFNIPAHPIANALVRCCREHPEELLPYLRRAQGEVREILARVAAEVASPEMADEMVLLAGDSLPEVRASSARALAIAPLPLALPVLAHLAQDAVWFVRLRAVASLDEIRHPRTIPILLEALCDSNRLVRSRSASALSEFIHDRTQILESVVDSHDRYALHAMISALELAGDFGKVIEDLLDPAQHDETAKRMLDALREGAASLWNIEPAAPFLEKV